MQARTGISERRACQLIGLSRSVLRYQPRASVQNELQAQLVELAQERRRFGYRPPLEFCQCSCPCLCLYLRPLCHLMRDLSPSLHGMPDRHWQVSSPLRLPFHALSNKSDNTAAAS